MKAIIIDDEENCIALLKLQLKLYCKDIEVIASTNDSEYGLELVKTLTFDLLFLDVEMPKLSGIQLMQSLNKINFSLVFVTAYEKYALKAFRFSAIDFLLKPVDANELIECIKKIKLSKINPNFIADQIDASVEIMDAALSAKLKHKITRLALPYQNGIVFVQIADIIYCEADNNYSIIHVDDKVQKYVLSKTLKYVQELLIEHEFIRVHRHFLININKIKKLNKGEGTYITLIDDSSIPVSKSNKNHLFEQFGWV
jgi:two-component system, LytTR family, response regulator